MKSVLKRLVAIFFPSMVCIIFVAMAIVYDEYTNVHSDNGSIISYQTQKITRPENANTQTIFLGDSSCGNSIDAELFTRLSQQATQNLCLTGSFGIASNMNLMRRAIKSYPNLKNAVFVTTPDMWTKSFPNEGNFSSGIQALGYVPYFDRMDLGYVLQRLLNLKIFWRALNAPKSSLGTSGMEYDYLKQGPKRFSNGGLPAPTPNLKHIGKISRDRVAELKALNRLCCELKGQVKCLLMPGPGIDTVVNNSYDFINHLRKTFKQHGSCVVFVDRFLSYPHEYMGDNSDHVDPAWKAQSTEDYFKSLKLLLAGTSENSLNGF